MTGNSHLEYNRHLATGCLKMGPYYVVTKAKQTVCMCSLTIHVYEA